MNGYDFEIEKKKIVATDGRRLAMSKIDFIVNENNTEKQYLIPSFFIDFLFKISDKMGDTLVKIGRRSNKILIKIEDYIFSFNEIDGTYPNYEQVIPKKTNGSFSFTKTESEKLIKALKKVASLDSNKTDTKIIFNEDEAIFQSMNFEFIREWGMHEIKIKMKYDSQFSIDEMAVNAVFLFEALEKMMGNVTITIVDKLGPMTISDSFNQDAFTLVMPMKIR